MQAEFDMITVSRFGIPKGYYWILTYKRNNDSESISHACKVMPTKEQAWDDLAVFMANLIEKVNSRVDDTQDQ